ncbi:hypothetical protein D3C72_1507800 [compost metagenome]
MYCFLRWTGVHDNLLQGVIQWEHPLVTVQQEHKLLLLDNNVLFVLNKLRLQFLQFCLSCDLIQRSHVTRSKAKFSCFEHGCIDAIQLHIQLLAILEIPKLKIGCPYVFGNRSFQYIRI